MQEPKVTVGGEVRCPQVNYYTLAIEATCCFRINIAIYIAIELVFRFTNSP